MRQLDIHIQIKQPMSRLIQKITFIIWADDLNFYGPGKPHDRRDIFSYHLETKQLTQLNQTSGPDFRSPSANKNHVTWTTYDNTKAHYDYDLDSNKESIIGHGANPIAGSNKIIYTTRAEGKPHKVALVACANKLVHWLHAILSKKAFRPI